MDGYEHHIFISYCRDRAPNVRDWVQNHFYPVLRNCLADELPEEPKVFLDVQQEIGVPWPENLSRSLHRSRMLVAVWSPPYFKSKWCMAEWHTMRQRELLLGVEGGADRRRLVYPVRYSDGNDFPAEAKIMQQDLSFTDWRFPYEQFSASLAYLDFHAAVMRMAEDLAGRLRDVPEWQVDWPVVRPDALAPLPAPLPRM